MAGEVDRLSGKLGIDTTDFKTAVRAADREIRVLQSSFKASAASLVDWTKDATGLENRVKTLTSQIDIQKLKVAALAAEHKRLAQENGENSIAAQEAEIKLNKETETLNKMQVELTGTEEELQNMAEGEDETGQAADDMGDSVEASGEKIDGMQTILAGVGAVVGVAVAAFAALGAAAVGAVKAISDLVFQAAEAGSALQDMSDQTGISTTRLQELSFIGNQVGTSLDTITGSQARLIRSMGSAQDQVKKYNEALAAGKKPEDLQLGDMADAFKSIGVSVVDANGNLRDSEDVFANVIDALGKIQNPAERDALAMQVFGKSAQELNPLIKLGSQGMAEMANQAHELGAVMSEENVAALDEFDDAMTGLQDGLKGTLGTLATAFLPVFKELATVFQDQVLPVIQKFIATAGKQLAPVIETIVSLIKQFASGDIKGGLARIFGVENAGAIINLANIVTDFIQNTLLPFFSGHAGDIQGTFQSIISGVISLATIITKLAIAWTETWFTMHDVLQPIWEGFIQPIFTQLLAWFADTLPVAISGLSTFWTETLLPAIQIVWQFMSENVLPILQAIGGFIATVFIASLKGLADMWQDVLLPAIQLVWKFLQDTLFPLLQAIGNFIGAVFNLALRIMAGLWQNILLPALQAVWKIFNDDILPILQTVGGYIASTFQPILEKLGSFLKNTLVPAWNAISTAIGKIIDFLKEMADRMNNMQLPWWLTPHSPTPFEVGLVGVGEAMAQLNKQMSVMVGGFSQTNFAGSAAGIPQAVHNSSSQNDSFQFFAPVVLQGNTPAGSLGARLKGRRY